MAPSGRGGGGLRTLPGAEGAVQRQPVGPGAGTALQAAGTVGPMAAFDWVDVATAAEAAALDGDAGDDDYDDGGGADEAAAWGDSDSAGAVDGGAAGALDVDDVVAGMRGENPCIRRLWAMCFCRDFSHLIKHSFCASFGLPHPVSNRPGQCAEDDGADLNGRCY